jgi:hypothetical protein
MGAIDRDALLPFQRIEIGGGVAIVHVANLVLGPAEVEDALRGGSFARVHVCNDADVSQIFKHGSSRPAANRPLPY